MRYGAGMANCDQNNNPTLTTGENGVEQNQWWMAVLKIDVGARIATVSPLEGGYTAGIDNGRMADHILPIELCHDCIPEVLYNSLNQVTVICEYK